MPGDGMKTSPVNGGPPTPREESAAAINEFNMGGYHGENVMRQDHLTISINNINELIF
jgi:hypothetical protein